MTFSKRLATTLALFATLLPGIHVLAGELMRVPGKPVAAQFELTAPDGSVHRLADYRGAPLILNFWATWCPPCRAEMPSLQRAHKQLARDGIAVLAINVGEDPETVDRFRRDFELELPLPIDTDTRVAEQYPMRGLPTTFVIDGEGRLALRAAGELAWDHPEVLERVRALK